MSEQMRGLPSAGLPNALWQASHPLPEQSLYSAFVTRLAAGTLPLHTFQHYIAQDATFLHSFANAYRTAADKARSLHLQPDVEGRLLRLLEGVEKELHLHASYAAKWGVDISRDCVPHPATTAYTDFLMSVARKEDAGVPDILAAMAPCSRLYGWIGCTLADCSSQGTQHQYTKWIDTYSSPEYLTLPSIKEQILIELTSSLSPSEAVSTHDKAGLERAWQDRLQPLYSKAMQLELDFFNAQPL